MVCCSAKYVVIGQSRDGSDTLLRRSCRTVLSTTYILRSPWGPTTCPGSCRRKPCSASAGTCFHRGLRASPCSRAASEGWGGTVEWTADFYGGTAASSRGGVTRGTRGRTVRTSTGWAGETTQTFWKRTHGFSTEPTSRSFRPWVQGRRGEGVFGQIHPGPDVEVASSWTTLCPVGGIGD